MKVLVVGGAGYIGSHACKALAMAGHEPVAYDNLVFGHADAVKWGSFEEGDILDADRLDGVMKAHRPELVMHFAALASVGESVIDPSKYYRNNVVGSLVLLDAMRRNAVGKIVFSSTCATYGLPDKLPISEATPQRPINPYGFSKLATEQALQDFGRAYALQWAAMRYFNAAGCDPDGELGERHDPETHAIPLAIRAALGTGPTFKVFGTDYPTPDGTAIRDYVHVSDLARAHVMALDHLNAGGESGAFNLATGNGTSVRQLLTSVEQAVGRPVPVELIGRREGDPPALLADASKARAILGWSPEFPDLDAIVQTAADWFRKEPMVVG